MFAYQFISNEIFALKPTDLSSDVLVFMDDWQVRDLPVVQSQKIIGSVNNKILLANKKQKVSAILSNQVSVCTENTHVYDLVKLFSDNEISTISVIDNEQNFKGIIAFKDISKILFQNSSLHQDGGIIVLQMAAQDYSLAEIARITEVNNAKILYAHVTSLLDEENNIHVSLKYNVTDLKHIIATFQRFNYYIFYSTQSIDIDDASAKKFEWLIKYLNT